MKPTPIKDPYAAQRAEMSAKKKMEQAYFHELDRLMRDYGFTRFDPPTAADFFTPDKIKELADSVFARVKIPQAEKVDYSMVYDYCDDYIKAMVAKIPKPKDGKTPTKSELLDIIRPLIPKAPQAEKVDYKGVEATIKKVLDALPKKQYVLERSQVVELVQQIVASTVRPQAARQFVGSVASLRQLTDVVLDGVPQDENGNYILGGGTSGPVTAEDVSFTPHGTVSATDVQLALEEVIDDIAALSVGAGITRTIVVTSSNVTAGATASRDYVYLVAGPHTVTLPTAVGNTNRYTIKNNHSADITLNTTASQTIDGTTSISINPQASVDIISTNINWSVV